MTDANLPDGTTLAALDLGSNSFHLLLARKMHGELNLLKRLGEKVQLAAGLDDQGLLSEEAQQRGLACLQQMAPFIQGLGEQQVKAVGTNALRAAHNSQEFLERAEEILGVPIEIIAGREEARLIYTGVVFTSPKIEGRRLVIDIGGGSTEFIIGDGAEPALMESLHMGCVSYTQRFFKQGQITNKAFQQARLAALSELLHIQKSYLGCGWQVAQGSSGSLKALSLIAGQGEFAPLTAKKLHELEKDLLKHKSADHWTVYGLRADRAKVLPAGLAIASAFFEALQIKEMHFVEGALREGLLYELSGLAADVDIRDRTLNGLQERFQVDLLQSQLVQSSCLYLLEQVNSAWGLMQAKWRDKLARAAALHEIGLSVAHTQYHKHGAYLMQYADLPGYTRLEQRKLAVLIRTHRRKFAQGDFKSFSPEDALKLKRLARLLRLSVLFHHSRPDAPLQNMQLSVDNTTPKESLHLQFPEGWLAEQPLLQADLEQEASWQAQAGFELTFS
ncbi:exopolyphosphatase [Marinospirillum sp. MEB164]|uniref:Exopolyphosphatase n=1 Tax=Marinospirillum alkalitolerans TaxID=3123374 RepID=A0ABW8PUQ8_9GAMM